MASDMSAREFIALAITIFGEKWRKPLARAIHRVPKQVRNYETGHTPIPQDIANKVRALAHIGTEGEIIKRAVLHHAPRVNPGAAHMIARDASEQIRKLHERGGRRR